MKNEKNVMFDQVCDFLGHDIDSEPCKIIQEHLKECQDCEIFVDKIKRTVKVYQYTNDCEKIPDQVSKKLFSTLHLDDLEGLKEK
jgi:predicted anti-sigma-YlaC factor YlaD